MRARSPVQRVALLLAAALQLVLPPAAAWADALLTAEQGGRRATPHAEDHTRPGCVPSHEQDCALCKVLSAAAAPPRGPLAPPVAAASRAPAAPRDATPLRVRHPHAASRAPPTPS